MCAQHIKLRRILLMVFVMIMGVELLMLRVFVVWLKTILWTYLPRGVIIALIILWV